MRRVITGIVRLAAIAPMMALSAQAPRDADKRGLALPSAVAQPEPYQTLASAPVPDMPGFIESLVTDGNNTAILITRDTGERRAIRIDSVDTLLGLLADRRVAPLWSALIDWAGLGAERLRDRKINEARRAFEEGREVTPASTADSSSRPKARALLQLATALNRGGEHDEALALLIANRPATPGKDDWDRNEWVALTVRIATSYAEAGELDRAVATLRDGEATMRGEQSFTINFKINRAAYLAEMGRAAEALALIDAAEAKFKRNKGSGDPVPASDREFSWIRACALHRLGRVAEAETEASAMLHADERPTDPQFVLKPTSQIVVRYARCIDDPKLAAQVLASEVRDRLVGARAFVLLQPKREAALGANAFFARVRREPAMIAALGDRFRELPDVLVPALNRWAPTPALATTPVP